MRLTGEQVSALDPDELLEGYRDGVAGWPSQQGASPAYLWGHDTGLTDGGHQPEYKFNQREIAAERLSA